jgi:hypothetical protein
MKEGKETNNTAKALSSVVTQFDTMAKSFHQSVNTIQFVSKMTGKNNNEKHKW